MSLKYNTLLPEHSKQHTGTQNCLHQTHQLLWVPFTKQLTKRTQRRGLTSELNLHCNKGLLAQHQFAQKLYFSTQLLQTRLRRDHLAVPHGAAWQNLAILDFIVGLKKNQQRKLRTPSKLSLKWRLCKCH